MIDLGLGLGSARPHPRAPQVRIWITPAKSRSGKLRLHRSRSLGRIVGLSDRRRRAGCCLRLPHPRFARNKSMWQLIQPNFHSGPIWGSSNSYQRTRLRSTLGSFFRLVFELPDRSPLVSYPDLLICPEWSFHITIGRIGFTYSVCNLRAEPSRRRRTCESCCTPRHISSCAVPSA